MQRKNYKAYFTVEAAVLYPIVLGVIVLMTYLLFFQYDLLPFGTGYGKGGSEKRQ